MYLDDDMGEFINNNPFLNEKQIMIGDEFEISHESLDPFIEKYGNYSNFRVLIDGNSRYVTIEEYMNTVFAMCNQTNKNSIWVRG